MAQQAHVVYYIFDNSIGSNNAGCLQLLFSISSAHVTDHVTDHVTEHVYCPVD